jgi:hypothetical protein
LLTLAGVALVLTLAHHFLLARHRDMGNERKFPRQMAMVGLTVAVAIAVASSLPVSESTRNQVIGLVGILVSGALAFSFTTVLANLMAGMVLRMTQSFQTGDFVRVGDYFGRVAERGIFDKAEEAGQRAKARHTLKEQRNKLEAQIEAADREDTPTLTAALDQVKAQMAELEMETPPG